MIELAATIFVIYYMVIPCAFLALALLLWMVAGAANAVQACVDEIKRPNAVALQECTDEAQKRLWQ